MLDYYNISPDQAMAFGGGTNDIEMLETVGQEIAMGNATQDVKAVANEICGSVQDDGIYEYCKKNELI